MPPFGPMKRTTLIRCLISPGYSGPYSGGNHQYIRKGSFRLTIPNQHQGDISRNLIADILRIAGIERDEWINLDCD